MQGDVLGQTGNIDTSKKLYVEFVLTPTNATLIVKDSTGKVLTPQSNHIYEVRAGVYSYSCLAENYKSVEDVAFEMTEEEEYKTINVTLQDARIFGVRRSLSTSSTAWERISNSVGLVANATKNGGIVQNDFDNIYPWSDIKSCDISANGTINSYIGDASYNPSSPKRLHYDRSSRILVAKKTRKWI